MKNCNCNTNCCGDGCKPAKYGCDFDIQASPYNKDEWVVTQGGMSHKVRIPKINETETSLGVNPSNSTLNYHGEKDTNTITGEQLGDIIKLEDLKDVDFDPEFTGTCSELIYRKFADCGEGCQSPADSWSGFNVNTDGIKKDAIRFVRGANVYGCPEYLDVPENLDEFWYAGWKRDGESRQFGYYQAEPVDTLPINEKGNVVVLSQAEDGHPVVGDIPVNCWFENIMGNFGMNVFGTWSVIQETPAFSSTFNPVTGNFSIDWADWRPTDIRVGYGKITGKVNWTATFDVTTGSMKYHISSIDFYKADWILDQGNPLGTSFYFTLKGVSIPSGAQTMLIDRKWYDGNASWHVDIDTQVPCNHTITVAPGQTVGPLNYGYIYVDGTLGDDEGYTQVNFKNNLIGWKGCA